MPSGGSLCFLRDVPPLSFILCFWRPIGVSPNLSYHSRFHHKSFLPFFHHSFFDVPKCVEHVFHHSHRDFLASILLCLYLFIADSMSYSVYPTERSHLHSSFFHSSCVIPTFRCCITASAPTLHCVRPNAQLCWHFAVSSGIPAAIRLSTSISYLPSLLNILPKYTTSFTCSNILPFTLILHSVFSSSLSKKTIIIIVFFYNNNTI